MGLIEFFVFVFVVVLLAALTTWAIKYFAPDTPPILLKIIWGVVVVMIVLVLLRATGIVNVDPQIPRLR